MIHNVSRFKNVDLLNSSQNRMTKFAHLVNDIHVSLREINTLYRNVFHGHLMTSKVILNLASITFEVDNTNFTMRNF